MNKSVNPFVYQRILENDIPNSTIPAWIGETYTQCYEDVIIDSLIRGHIRRIGRPLNGMTFIEIGANHPVCTNSTYLWKRKYGLSGILVEANPKLIPNLQKFRNNDTIINAAVYDQDQDNIDFFISPENEISSLNEYFVNSWKNLGVQEKISVPTIRINTLFDMIKNIETIVLIIDVEGMDLRILKDINFEKYRPLIIEIEPSDWLAPGTSTAMIDFLKTKNYDIISETDVNLIFLDKSSIK